MTSDPGYDYLVRQFNKQLRENSELRKRLAGLDRMATVMRQEIDGLEAALRRIDPNHPALTKSLAIFRAYLEECERQEASDG